MRCQGSGVRCQASGVRGQVSVRRSGGFRLGGVHPTSIIVGSTSLRENDPTYLCLRQRAESDGSEICSMLHAPCPMLHAANKVSPE